MKRLCKIAVLAAALLLLAACAGQNPERERYWAVVCGQNGAVLRTLTGEETEPLDALADDLNGREPQDLPGELTVRLEYVLYLETAGSAGKADPLHREYEEADRIVLYLEADWVSDGREAAEGWPVPAETAELLAGLKD